MAEVTISATDLPNTPFSGDLNATLQLFADHLEGTFNGSVLTGQQGGSAPTSDIGVWQNGNVLYTWNSTEARYLPVPLAIGRVQAGTLYLTTLQSLGTANRTQYLPDKDGTLATTGDVYGTNQTQTLSGASPSIDWSQNYSNYYLILSANAALSASNATDGQVRHVWVENPPSATYTFTISNAVTSGTMTADTSTGATNRAITHYVLRQVSGTLFATKSEAGYDIDTASGAGADTTAPTASSASRQNSTGTVYMTMSEACQATTLSTGDFVVTKGGVNQTISSASVTGSVVTCDTATTFTTTSTVTVKYTGTAIKDLAGNAATGTGFGSFLSVPNSTAGNPVPPGPGDGQNVP